MYKSELNRIINFLMENDMKALIDQQPKTEELPVFGHKLSDFQRNQIKDFIKGQRDEEKAQKKVITINHFLIKIMQDKRINLNDREIADKINVSKSYISMMRKDNKASKKNLIKIAILLRLTLDETKELLKIAGHGFDYSIQDQIINACISMEIYSFKAIDEALSELDKQNVSIFEDVTEIFL